MPRPGAGDDGHAIFEQTHVTPFDGERLLIRAPAYKVKGLLTAGSASVVLGANEAIM